MAPIAPFVLRNARRAPRAIALHIEHRRSDHLPHFTLGPHHPIQRFLASLRVNLIACTFLETYQQFIKIDGENFKIQSYPQ